MDQNVKTPTFLSKKVPKLLCFFVVLFCGHSSSHGSDIAEQFISTPDFRTSEGIILFHKNTISSLAGAETRIIWSYGDVIVETLNDAVMQADNVDSVMSSSGQFKGTNWWYDGATLTTGGQLPPAAKALQERTGVTPEQYQLSCILGRGFSLKEMETMRRLSNSSAFFFRFDNKVPTTVTFKETTNSLIQADFILSLQSGQIDYKRIFQLALFSTNQYIPKILQCYMTRRGATEVLKDLVVDYSTNSIGDTFLDPRKRYVISQYRYLDIDRLYVVGPSNNLTPILRRGELDQASSNAKSKAQLFFALGIVSLFYIIWICLRQKSKRGQQNQTPK